MRFHGRVGFGTTVETSPGVSEETMVERSYYGDVSRNMSLVQDAGDVNPDLGISNEIHIVSDGYANDHFANIRYVEWSGVVWAVTHVVIQRPRLLLTLGGVYHGPKAPAPVTP